MKSTASRRIFMGTIGKIAIAFSASIIPQSCSRLVKPKTSDPKRPNILFIIADQFRSDAMGCADNPVIKTPNIDAIAHDGVRFSAAYSSTPSCTPARAGILTGLSPWHHGMLGYASVAERYPFEMPRVMTQAGYRTFAIGKNHFNPQRNPHGYESVLLDESGRIESKDFVSDYRQWFKKQAPDLNPDATGIGWNDFQSAPYALPEELHPTKWTADMAVKFLEENEANKPFFLKVSFARPHSPYDPPRRFMDIYKDKDIPRPWIGDWAEKYADVKQPPPSSTWRGNLGEEQAIKSRRGYYGSVTFIDSQIGRILQALRNQGMYDDTLIVFTSDHGDMLGDHNLWRKTYAYEGSAKIPMLIRWPSQMAPGVKRGQTLPHPVELRDLLPTFLDAAQVPIPGNLDGDSLLKPVRDVQAKWRPFIDLEHDVCYSQQNHWNALTDGKIKYILHAFDATEQLFDLQKDPEELNDLSQNPESQETLLTWRERIVEFFQERGEEFVKDGKLQPRPKRMLYSPHYPKKR